MEPITRGRYRGQIVSRNSRESKDGQSEMLDFKLIAKEFFDETVGQWVPLPEEVLIDGSYFIRNSDGVNRKALDDFAEASGWDGSEEQFADESWRPKPLQASVDTKAKPDGKGVWFTFTGIAVYDAIKCGPPPRKSASFSSTIQKYREGKATPPPTVPKKAAPF